MHKIIETEAIKIGATHSFLSKMADGLRILFGGYRIIGVLHGLCHYPFNFFPDIFFGHMLRRPKTYLFPFSVNTLESALEPP